MLGNSNPCHDGFQLDNGHMMMPGQETSWRGRFWERLCPWLKKKKVSMWGVACGSVAGTWCFHCHGLGPIPGRGTKILWGHVAWPKRKRKQLFMWRCSLTLESLIAVSEENGLALWDLQESMFCSKLEQVAFIQVGIQKMSFITMMQGNSCRSWEFKKEEVELEDLKPCPATNR